MKRIIRFLQKHLAFDYFTLLFSCFIGIAIWYYVETSRTEERQLTAEISVRIPRGWEAQGTLPKSRSVIVKGARNVIASLSPGDIHFRVFLDIDDNASSLQDVHIELKPDNLKGLPEDVIVERIFNPQLIISLVKPVRKYIPVKIETTGSLPEGYEISNISYSPRYIAINAPQNEFSENNIARTYSINLSNHTSSFSSYIDLQPLKLKDSVKYFSQSISVSVEINPAPATKIYKNIPISILLATRIESLAGGKLFPPQVSIEVEGNKLLLDKTESKAFTIYIDTRDMGSSVQGEYTLKCRAISPPGIKVVNIIPGEIRWKIPQNKPKEIKDNELETISSK